MRATPSEKIETIRLVEDSILGVKRTLAELGVPRSTSYRWYQAYSEHGEIGLAEKEPGVVRQRSLPLRRQPDSRTLFAQGT